MAAEPSRAGRRAQAAPSSADTDVGDGPAACACPTPTVVFLSYFGHQRRLFNLLAAALPPEVAARQLHVYALGTRAAVDLSLWGNNLAPEIVARITVFEARKRARKQPGTTVEAHQQRLAPAASKWYHMLRRELEGADLLVVWSGFRLPLSAALAAADSLGVRTLHCENGPLPGTMAMDPRGVNFAGSVAGRSREAFLQTEMDADRAQALLTTTLQQRPRRRSLLARAGTADDDKPLPERHVLFAMQVHDDSQVLLFSPRFARMEETVRYVAAQVEEHNARTGDTLALVVKEHPSDFGRVDYRALRAELASVRFLRSTPISALVGQAKAVITVNSSVGVEALLRQRPVITLGDAFYNVPGVVRHLEADEHLAGALGEVIDRPVDTDLVTRFLYFLRYEYLLPISIRTANADNIQPAVQRVLDVLHGRLTWAR